MVPSFFPTAGRDYEMQANADTLINLLKVASQFVIPIFQRPYAWTEEQVATLWKDILETGSPGGKPTHFLGSVAHREV